MITYLYACKLFDEIKFIYFIGLTNAIQNKQEIEQKTISSKYRNNLRFLNFKLVYTNIVKLSFTCLSPSGECVTFNFAAIKLYHQECEN